MLIRKTAGFFLAALLLAASALGIVAAFPSRVAAADTPATLTTENASLFLPASYENYLELSAPSSVAIGKRYVAIADEKKIYIYDRMEPSAGYRVWEHKKDTEGVTVGKMQFTDDDRLFFLSASGLYELTLSGSLEEKKMSDDFTPYTFLIAENILYAVTATDGSNTVLYRFKMQSEPFMLATAASTPVSDSSSQQSSPLLAYEGGTVYCFMNATVYKYNGESLQGSGNFPLDSAATGVLTLGSVCALNGSLYFTDKTGLHCADMNGSAKLIVPAGDINALYPRDNLLYCLYGKAVRAYDTAANTFTDYEISSSSDSVNRLNGAKDIVRAGGLLVTADTNNKRISVYDMQKQSYAVIPLNFAPIYAATDGTLVAAADTSTIHVFASDYKGVWQSTQTFSLPQPNNDTLKGIVCEFGQVYYVSEHYHGNLVETPVLNEGIPAGLAANLYGDLFVAYEGSTVKCFTEETFTQGGNSKETNITLPSDFTCLRADFEGNLYYLNENGELCCNGKEQPLAKIDATKYVYTVADHSPVSFALGYEDDEVYFCFGDFIVKSNAGALGLATLETLSETVLNEAEETLSEVADAETVQLVDCNPGAVGVQADLSALQGNRAFAAGYYRYTEARRGVVLDRQEEYTLVAVYDDHVYTAEIFRNEDVGVPFSPDKIDGEGANMYLASDCPAYHFPCIAEAPARDAALPRGTRVTVISYLGEGGADEAQGGYPFAYIEYETKTRSVVRGYVPASYLTAADPLGDTEDNYTLGYVKPGATFTGSDGSEVVTEERVMARLYKNEDGTYTARYEEDGVEYTATVEEKQIEWGESDAWRIALIVILSVVAVLIIGGYVFLLPRRNKKQTK